MTPFIHIDFATWVYR